MRTHKFKPYGVNGPYYEICIERIVAFFEINFNGNYGTEIHTDDGNRYHVGDGEEEVRIIVNACAEDTVERLEQRCEELEKEMQRESIELRSRLGSALGRNSEMVKQQAKANERVIDSIIEPLYKARWSGDLSDAPVSEMRDQLFKTLRDQTMGYWSGHTAYNIAVDGGFLINDKKGANKRLTSLGAMFVEQEQ